MKKAVALLACLALAACAGASGSPDRYGRLLTPRAEPSEVIATELAFARVAREEGRSAAFRQFAADEAMVVGPDGAIEAQAWLEAQPEAATPATREPQAVWSSCDGSLAVTEGAFQQQGGDSGRFNTVWQRQRDGDYKWVLDFTYPAAASPATPGRIAGKVADCGGVARADPAHTEPTSRDGTLAWSFALTDQGTRAFKAWMAGSAGMEPIVDLSIPLSGGQGR